MNIKFVFSNTAIVLTFYAFVPYIYSILKGSTKPHVFSWVIWATTTLMVFFAQLNAGAGMGAWAIGVSGTITIGIAVQAVLKKSGDASITKLDCFFFITALSAIPAWYLTDNALWAVIVLTSVDLLGFGPTFRKAYDYPHQENRLFFVLFLLRNSFTILALENYSLTTILFPLSIAIACSALLIVITYRLKLVNTST